MEDLNFEKFILNFWETYIDKSVITLIDSKTLLQEYSLKNLRFCQNIHFLKKLDHNTNHFLKLKLKFQSQKITGEDRQKKKHSKMLQVS